jgi:hypothetical protein
MTARAAILALGMLLSASLCKAQDVCTWVTTATVIDAPDPAVSDVQTAVTNGGNICTFHYRKADSLYNVQITIHTSSDNSGDMAASEKQCGSDKSALTGIGNEAVLCSTGAREERVVGRVRDQIFVVNVSVKAARDSTEMAKSLGDKAMLLAAQVAGNLF